MKKMILDYLDSFKDSIVVEIEKKEDEYLQMWKEYPLLHLENALRDKVIVYMGDKESERSGTEEDVMEIAAHSYLLWLKKKNEHLI